MIKKLLMALCVMAVVAFGLCARGKKPYYITGYATSASGDEYSKAGLNIEFYNRSEKDVVHFTVMFCLSDADGISLFKDVPYAMVKVEIDVEPYENVNKCISLDDLIEDASDDTYDVEWLSVTSIVYADGSMWQDD